MTIADADMAIYDFGEKKIWPKPHLDSPYDVLDHYCELMSRLGALSRHVNVSSGRQDHLVKSLDTTAYALKECLFRVMVLRESMTGFATCELAEKAEVKS